jgi:predicted glycogen debranching enzyme
MDLEPQDIEATTAPPRGRTEPSDSIRAEWASLSREWIDTNGAGGYASLSGTFCPTRRQHGLLVAPLGARGPRHVFLSRLEEMISVGNRSHRISAASYAGAPSPERHPLLRGLTLQPFPRFVYEIEGHTLERELISTDEPGVVLRWRWHGREPVRLELRPLLPFREADALTFENVALDPKVHRHGDEVGLRPYPTLPALHLMLDPADRFEADPLWYRNLQYGHDLARGYEGHEDQFSPGFWDVELGPGQPVVLHARIAGGNGSPSARPRARFDSLAERRLERRSPGSARGIGARRARLSRAADDFLVRTSDGRRGIVAGFPWFGEWGRDTYLALPGLSLARGRFQTFKEVSMDALTFLRGGLLPNVFGPTPAQSDYNSADAALWFARAVAILDEMAETPERDEIVAGFLPALLDIARHHLEGIPELALECDATGMIVLGDPRGSGTWMDARVADEPVTPRDGCPVEINALWHSLLCMVARLHARAGKNSEAAAWRARADRQGEAFLARLWLDDEAYLADRWSPESGADPSIRPNMVLAAALRDSPLSDEQRRGILAVAECELLTPRGLRTLAPSDPAYRGRYEGDTKARDEAYHQGTVWPWLLGAYVEASARVGGDPQRSRALLDGVLEELDEIGLDHVSEVFDGDEPRRGGGCFAQAWNSAELLRAYWILDRGLGG